MKAKAKPKPKPGAKYVRRGVRFAPADEQELIPGEPVYVRQLLQQSAALRPRREGQGGGGCHFENVSPRRKRKVESKGKFTRSAIRRAEVIRQPCSVCGEPYAHAQHWDYSKPFEIQWLCRRHHLELMHASNKSWGTVPRNAPQRRGRPQNGAQRILMNSAMASPLSPFFDGDLRGAQEYQNTGPPLPRSPSKTESRPSAKPAAGMAVVFRQRWPFPTSAPPAKIRIAEFVTGCFGFRRISRRSLKS